MNIEKRTQQRIDIGGDRIPKKIWVAALLSFIFSGLGQLYAGAIKSGVFFIIMYILLVIGGGVEIFGTMAQAAFVLGIPVLWLIGIIHAVLVTKQKNLSTNDELMGHD